MKSNGKTMVTKMRKQNTIKPKKVKKGCKRERPERLDLGIKTIS